MRRSTPHARSRFRLESNTMNHSTSIDETLSCKSEPHNLADQQPHLWLNSFIHVHVTPTASIFLDVRRDRYFGLTQEQTKALGGTVIGWPLNPEADQSSPSHATELIDWLVRDDVLTFDRNTGRPAVPPDISALQERLVDPDDCTPVEVGFDHVIKFLRAYWRALALLRFRSLESAVNAVRARNAKICSSPEPEALALARKVSRAYARIRPFFIQKRDRCLFESLVLTEFLSQYEIHASWVIGVRTSPFMAHSWVQIDRFIVNGNPTFSQLFTPILVA